MKITRIDKPTQVLDTKANFDASVQKSWAEKRQIAIDCFNWEPTRLNEFFNKPTPEYIHDQVLNKRRTK